MWMCWCPGKFCKFSGNVRRRNFLFFSQLFLCHVRRTKFWHVLLHVLPRFFWQMFCDPWGMFPRIFIFGAFDLPCMLISGKKICWSCPENGHTALACTVVACPWGCWFGLYDVTERTCNILHARTTLVCTSVVRACIQLHARTVRSSTPKLWSRACLNGTCFTEALPVADMYRTHFAKHLRALHM